VRGTEAEQVRTPLFLMDSDPVDFPFALVADKDSEEDSGRGSEHENENEGRGDENQGCGNETKRAEARTEMPWLSR
jgi:hypothetical protein